jgi:hypothetical protein
MGRIVGFSSNHTRVQVVSVGASGLINFDHTTLFAPFLRSEEYPSSTFSALRSVHDAASNKIPLVIKYPFDQNVTRDSMYAFGQNGPSSCNSTARALATIAALVSGPNPAGSLVGVVLFFEPAALPEIAAAVGA